MWGDIAIAFTIAFISTFMITPHTINLAKKLGAVDTPQDDRRMNKVIMPRLGGLAIIIGFFLSSIYLLSTMTIEGTLNLLQENYYMKVLGFVIGALLIGVTCFIDDVKGVRAIIKLIVQIAAAVICVKCGIRIDRINIPFLNFLDMGNIMAYLVTIIWIVGITNAINLIDGLDGLSTGIAIISCISLMVIFSLNGSPLVSIILITSLCGALVGFLPYNFNPAKTFMGDTGSNFIGYCLSILSIIGMAKTYTAIVLIAPLIVFGLPLFDTSFAIVRRLIKGKSIKAVFKPDAGHLHHRLIKHGFTQKQAVLILYAVTAFLGIFAIILIESGIWKATSFALIILIMCLVGYKEVVKQKLLVGDRYEPKKGDETLLFERDEDVQNKDQIRMEDLDHIRKEK